MNIPLLRGLVLVKNILAAVAKSIQFKLTKKAILVLFTGKCTQINSVKMVELGMDLFAVSIYVMLMISVSIQIAAPMHWEKIIGIFSVVDGEILRFILHSNIPLEKIIRDELAGRGYDENHRWCGFKKAQDIWLKQLN